MLTLLKKFLVISKQADKYPFVPWMNRDNKHVYYTGIIRKRKRIQQDEEPVTKL